MTSLLTVVVDAVTLFVVVVFVVGVGALWGCDEQAVVAVMAREVE